jgi:anti-anti-sigma regulatory factor
MDIEKPRKPRAPRKSKTAATSEVTDDMNTPIVESGAEPTGSAAAPAPEGAAAPVPAILHLGAGLEIKDVETVHRQLAGMLDGGSPVTVDISHVAAMDTAGVQLLLAFQNEAAKRGLLVEYSGRSTAFTHALTAVGLGDAVRHAASRD